MRVLVVARRVAPEADTGRAVAFRRLVRRLSETHEVQWVVGWTRQRSALPEGCLGVDLRGQGRLHSHLSLWRAGRSAVRRFRPDVVLAAGLDVPMLGPPTVALVRDLQGTGWGASAQGPDWWRRWRGRSVAAVVVPSHGAADALVRIGVTRNRIQVIPDAIEAPEGQVAGPGDREVGRLVHAGRLHPAKGQHLSVDAVSRLGVEDKARVTLDVVGRVADPTYATQLRVAGTGQPVAFHEDVPSLAPWLHQAQALLYPTALNQEWPAVPLQAMAAGTPVIWSDRPTLREAFGGLGLPVEPGDLGALRVAIRRCLHEPQAVADLGLAGREFVRANYSCSRVSSRWAQCLEGIVRGA